MHYLIYMCFSSANPTDLGLQSCAQDRKKKIKGSPRNVPPPYLEVLLVFERVGVTNRPFPVLLPRLHGEVLLPTLRQTELLVLLEQHHLPRFQILGAFEDPVLDELLLVADLDLLYDFALVLAEHLRVHFEGPRSRYLLLLDARERVILAEIFAFVVDSLAFLERSRFHLGAIISALVGAGEGIGLPLLFPPFALLKVGLVLLRPVDHILRFDPGWLVVDVGEGHEALVLGLVGFGLADVYLFADEFIIFLLQHLVLLDDGVQPVVLVDLLVLFAQQIFVRLPQEFVGILLQRDHGLRAAFLLGQGGSVIVEEGVRVGWTQRDVVFVSQALQKDLVIHLDRPHLECLKFIIVIDNCNKILLRRATFRPRDSLFESVALFMYSIFWKSIKLQEKRQDCWEDGKRLKLMVRAGQRREKASTIIQVNHW